jgi:hypothetical protein
MPADIAIECRAKEKALDVLRTDHPEVTPVWSFTEDRKLEITLLGADDAKRAQVAATLAAKGPKAKPDLVVK